MRRGLLHAGELLLGAVVAVVLPVTVTNPALYLACACPCLLAAAVFGFIHARTRR